jgi:hypothetical protein
VLQVHNLSLSHIKLHWLDQDIKDGPGKNGKAAMAKQATASSAGRNALDVLAEAAHVDGSTVHGPVYTQAEQFPGYAHVGMDHNARLPPQDAHVAIDSFTRHFLDVSNDSAVGRTNTTGKY